MVGCLLDDGRVPRWRGWLLDGEEGSYMVGWFPRR